MLMKSCNGLNYRYDYSFPFLDTGGLVTVDENRISPRHDHALGHAHEGERRRQRRRERVLVPKSVVVPRFYEAQAR